MASAELISFAYNDVTGLTRAKSFPAEDLPERLDFGIGWTPANHSILPFGGIAFPNPWGSHGDLRLIADPVTEARVLLDDGAAPLHLYLCSVNHTDGRPWDACPRHFCDRALQDFEAATGLRIRSAFEHEFMLPGIFEDDGLAFSLQSYREAEPFGSRLMEALRAANAEPELFLAEYGAQQFEVACRSTVGLRAADRAVTFRAVVAEVARSLGLHATFSPSIDPEGTGNGVHIHFSFEDRDGRNVTFDESGTGGMSTIAAGFAAGVYRHLPALCAITAPSPVSYVRLAPGRWSAAFTVVGYRNREAAIRISPTDDRPGGNVGRAYNLEYRPTDATASPYLALGAIVRAGLQGIREGLEPPPLVDNDPAQLSEEEREAAGAARLPTSLDVALAALEEDDIVRSWLPDELWQCYLPLKRAELEHVEKMDLAEVCATYANVY